MNGLPSVLSGDALGWDQAVRLFQLRCKAQNLSPSTQGNYARTITGFRVQGMNAGGVLVKALPRFGLPGVAKGHPRFFRESIDKHNIYVILIDERNHELRSRVLRN